MSCLFASCQAPLQASLRPAIWVPGIRNLHERRERWSVKNATAEEAFDDAIHAVKKLEDKEFEGKTIHLAKTDRNRLALQCHCFTRAQWLDVIEISFQERGGQTQATAHAFSSGLFPLVIPIALPLNVIFFWAPFWDNGFNKKWLEIVRRNMDLEITIENPV